MPRDFIKAGLSIVARSGKAIIASVDEDGFPNLKAMYKPRENEGLKVFYFTTNTASMRVKHYLKNPKASIYFFDSRFFKGLMLKGMMDVLLDQPTRDRIWRDGDEMYYALGVTNPDYCVLKFTANKARMYENFHSYDFKV
jgi:general stress protein 26